MIIKRKKVTRYRGYTTHGGGSKKKRRGAGNRGGRGLAGSGKRADQKKQTIFKLYGPEYFGKHGFRRPQRVKKKIKTINLDFIENNYDKYKGNYDLIKLGYDKLLGKGRLTKKVDVRVKKISKKAKERIEALDGKVEVI